MKVAFYTNIRPANNQTEADVIRKAAVLGYELVPFNGWDDADLGPSGNHGPRWLEAKANGEILRVIQDACELNDDFPHITQTKKIIRRG